MKIVNSCETSNRGAWKFVSIRFKPPWMRMSCRNGRTRPMIAMTRMIFMTGWSNPWSHFQAPPSLK